MEFVSAKKNAVVNMFGWFLPTIVFIVITPVMVNKLGTEGFGIIAIIQILTGYMTVLNLGFSEAIIKQVAENINSDRERATRIMWVGLGLFVAAGGIGLLIIYFSAPWMTYSVLNIPPDLQSDTVSALRIGSIVFLLQMVSEFYRGTAIGCSNFVVPNVSKLIRVTISAILIWFVLENGGGLVAVMTATLSGLILGLIINIIWMQRIVKMHWIPDGYTGITAELLHFGKHILISRLAIMVSSKLSQLVLGSISSVANVALYEVPVRAVTAGSTILNQAMQVFFPGISSMDKTGDIDRIRNMYFSVISIQLFLTIPLFLTAALEGNTLLAVWINDEFSSETGSLLFIVLAAYFLSTMSSLPSLFAMSFNHPRVISRYSIIGMVVTLATVYPLVETYGLIGAAWVLLLSGIVSIPFIYEATRLALGVNIFVYLRAKLVKHTLISLIIVGSYEIVYRQSAWYHPALALSIPIIYYILALMSGATSRSENRQMLKLFLKWR